MKINWDLKKLNPQNLPILNTSYQEPIQKAAQTFTSTWKENKSYLENPESLKKALADYENFISKHGYGGNFGYYIWLLTTIDQENAEVQAAFNKLMLFEAKIENMLQFFVLSLGKISIEKQKEFLTNENLKKYKHFLEKLFSQAKHHLSDKEEKILNLKIGPAYINWKKMTEQFLGKEEREILTEENKTETKSFSTIMSLVNHKNKKIRDSSANAINNILEKHSDVATAEINSILADKQINDQLRGFEKPETSRHMSDDIESSCVNSLVETVSKYNDLSHEYYKLKAKLFGIEKLAYHERSVPYGNIDKKYSYQESIPLVKTVLKKLDPEFEEIFSNFCNNGQIDALPKKGKRSGAFCAHTNISTPTYIMLNHTNKLQDVLTIAHEVGHGINNELVRKNQNALNFGTPTSTAEVASTFMEDFVLDHLVKDLDEEGQLSMMMLKLDQDIACVFRQIACYKFEQELHQIFRETGYISKEKCGEIFQKHMKEYMGSAVEQSKGSQNWWVYWSHIRNYFYVYSYAGGLLISKALQAKVKQDPKFISQVKIFLGTGLAKSPKEIFNNLGIDISQSSFWESGIFEIKKLLEDTQKLAHKLGKI